VPRPFGACGINTSKKGIHFLITQERCKKKNNCAMTDKLKTLKISKYNSV